MASETETPTPTRTATLGGNWKAGVAGGIVGALVFSAMMAMQMPGVLEMAIPAMYGIEGAAMGIGFVIHLFHGAVIGAVYAGLVGVAGLERSAPQTQVAAGLGYGIITWAILAVVVMPLWLSAVGFPNAPPLPNVGMESLVGHAVYGAVLGTVYYALEGL